MSNLKNSMLATTAAFGLMVSGAQADMGTTNNGFTSHHLVVEKPYASSAQNLSAEEKLELREYIEYDERERCQGYQEPPQSFIQDGCSLQEKANDVLASYKFYFDFDKSDIRESEKQIIDRIVREIEMHNPAEVIVSGHTDRSGSMDYNRALSSERADRISDALTERGVENSVVDENFYGESRPAVPTADGVRAQENRRVVVRFLR